MTSRLERAYEILSLDDEGRVCRDIPDNACAHQPENFFTHTASLAASKTADALTDPKLVLAWLMTAVGAPSFLIGLLVPVREALAVLPQLATAAYIRALAQRKWVWAAGSAVQGFAVLGIAAAGLTLEGAVAGWTIVALLALFAVARSACSVSYKDVQGKTLSKTTRGTATGTAGTIAAIFACAFGLSLAFGVLPQERWVICTVLAGAGALWLVAATCFAGVVEKPGASEGGGNALATAHENIALLARDRQLALFIAVRALLTATALAPPFLLAGAGGEGGAGSMRLGLFVALSAFASAASAYLWGRFADRSSRFVLVTASAIGSVALAVAGGFLVSGAGSSVLGAAVPAAFFVLQLAYQGVRLGRSTHIVDMADADRRAAYTALANTVIGIVLLAAGGFGVLADVLGNGGVLLVFAAMCAWAAVLALALEEVEAG